MAVNQLTIARASYRLGAASDYTQVVRWQYESAVAPLRPTATSGGRPRSLAGVANLVYTALATPPPGSVQCIPALVYSGGFPDTLDFSTTYDGDGMNPVDFTLMDGGLPDTNFC